jgi:hypothetical protein
MPNDCFNNVTIGANPEIIIMLIENEFLFNLLRPVPEDNDSYDWRIQSWGTQWERTEYSVLKKGSNGLKLRFKTSWNPPYELFNYLIETYDLWLKCSWFEEGGTAGVFVGKYNGNNVEVQQMTWDDWSNEEYSYRMNE